MSTKVSVERYGVYTLYPDLTRQEAEIWALNYWGRELPGVTFLDDTPLKYPGSNIPKGSEGEKLPVLLVAKLAMLLFSEHALVIQASPDEHLQEACDVCKLIADTRKLLD